MSFKIVSITGKFIETANRLAVARGLGAGYWEQGFLLG